MSNVYSTLILPDFTTCGIHDMGTKQNNYWCIYWQKTQPILEFTEMLSMSGECHSLLWPEFTTFKKPQWEKVSGNSELVLVSNVGDGTA